MPVFIDWLPFHQWTDATRTPPHRGRACKRHFIDALSSSKMDGNSVPLHQCEHTMNRHETYSEFPVLGPEDPPIDFRREEAAYDRERPRLVREHLGRIALIRGDDMIGAFSSADEAILEAFQRFGTERVMLKEIRDPDPPDFVACVDLQHPSVKRLS
jgi:hypothetical protein